MGLGLRGLPPLPGPPHALGSLRSGLVRLHLTPELLGDASSGLLIDGMTNVLRCSHTLCDSQLLLFGHRSTSPRSFSQLLTVLLTSRWLRPSAIRPAQLLTRFLAERLPDVGFTELQLLLFTHRGTLRPRLHSRLLLRSRRGLLRTVRSPLLGSFS